MTAPKAARFTPRVYGAADETRDLNVVRLPKHAGEARLRKAARLGVHGRWFTRLAARFGLVTRGR